MSKVKSYNLPLTGWAHSTKVWVAILFAALVIGMIYTIITMLIRKENGKPIVNYEIAAVLIACGIVGVILASTTEYARGTAIDTDQIAREVGISDVSVDRLPGRTFDTSLDSRYNISFRDSNTVNHTGYLLVKDGKFTIYVQNGSETSYVGYNGR